MEKLVDARAVAAGVVEDEVEIGGDAQAERVGELVADEADGIVERGDALLLLALVAFDGDIDARGLAAGGHGDFIDGDQADARVGELPGDDDDEFFLDRLDEAVLMMLCTAVFQERCSCAQ